MMIMYWYFCLVSRSVLSVWVRRITWTEEGTRYKVIELDELDGNGGNDSRATLGMLTKQTSVPSIFIKGKPIGGLNDGTHARITTIGRNGQLKSMLLM